MVTGIADRCLVELHRFVEQGGIVEVIGDIDQLARRDLPTEEQLDVAVGQEADDPLGLRRIDEVLLVQCRREGGLLGGAVAGVLENIDVPFGGLVHVDDETAQLGLRFMDVALIGAEIGEPGRDQAEDHGNDRQRR